jgi:hypothetical protein
MVQLCRHIHPDGRACNSPALRRQDYCYFHAQGRRPAGPRLATNRPGYRWYALQRQVHLLDAQEIQLALTEICNALVSKEIGQHRMQKLLNAIEARGTVLRRRDKRNRRNSTESAENS